MSSSPRSRSFRAVLGHAITWGVAWGAGITLVAGAMKLLGVAPAEARWVDAIGLGVRGGVVGAAASLSFSMLLRLRFRGRALPSLHWLPVGLAGGAAAAVFVPLFLQLMNVLSGDGPVAWHLVTDDAGIGFVLGAVASAGTLLVAQRAQRTGDSPTSSETGRTVATSATIVSSTAPDALPSGVKPMPDYSSARRAATGASLLPLLFLGMPQAATGQGVASPAASTMITGRFGVGGGSDAYQDNCGHSSLAFGLDVRRSGRLFPLLAVDAYRGSGGGDVLCLAMPLEAEHRGGLRLDGATRVRLGGGVRAGHRLAHLELAATAGLVHGRLGYAPPGDVTGARVLPQVGGSLAVVLLRMFEVSMGIDQTRLSSSVMFADGRPPLRRARWELMTTLQLGVRVPASW